MNRHLVAVFALLVVPVWLEPNAAQASGAMQEAVFLQPQQSTSQSISTVDSSQQNNQQSTQTLPRADDNSTQNAVDPNVLTPSQQSTNQNQRQQQQTNERNGRLGDREQPEGPVLLSEFQRLVAASVGRVLPIYGAKLFANVPSTFAPVNRIPVTPDYVIGPGDELLVRAWGQVTLDGQFVVDRSGSIFIPRVGAIHVAGVSFDHVTEFIRSQMARNFKNFDLNVNMGQLRSIQIFVVGEAKRPGSYTISSLSTLVNALFSCGGPTPLGSMRNIQVKRGKETIGTFDLYDLLLKGDKSKDVPLLSGDVVYIPPVGPMVALAGSIDNPALYEIKPENTVKDVIALAGGLTTLARQRDARIERVQRRDSRSVVDINLDETGLATPLLDGDILEISAIVDRFKDAVTLRGNIADPRRFAWRPGMRVRDLIPDKDALLTRDYWQQRNQLGLPMLESTPDVRRYAPDTPVAQVNGVGISPSQTISSITLPNARDSESNVYGNTLTNPLQGKDARRGVGPDNRSAQSQMGSSGVSGTATTDDRADSTRTSTRTSTQTAGSLLTAPDAQMDAAGSDASGTSISSSVTGTAQRFPVKNQVVLTAPEIDWAYAVVQRLDKRDLTTVLLPFNLGRAVLDGDSTQNLELEPGDVVTIFSKADIRVPQAQQTKFVRLEGEFKASGTYSVLPGETLRQLVARAGGLTPGAYLYGSQFTRESTKVIQQHRLNDYAADLDRRIKLAEANSTSNALNPQDLVADIGALQNARNVAMRLRQLSASGRIVLNLRPDSTSVDAIPEMPLEDGDTFVVPQTPASVDVYGSVYTQSSFLYDSHKRAKDYVRQAGGGTRTADTGRSYIVHADGSVVSRQFSTALFTGNFDATRLFPGDAVIVPEQIGKRPALRNLVDIATIVGQFGLGVAAINVLK